MLLSDLLVLLLGVALAVMVVLVFLWCRDRRTLGALRLENQRLREQPDPVTGLLSRTPWTKAAQVLLTELSEPGLIFADLNNFKQVNDRLGHRAGDLLLAEFAARLREQFGPQALIGRLGGDEFVILLDLPGGRWDDRLADAAMACTLSSHGITCGGAFGVARPIDVAHRDGAPDIVAACELVRCQLGRIMHAADLASLRAKRFCHTTGSPVALAVYGPTDPAVPAQLDPDPAERVRDAEPRGSAMTITWTLPPT